MRACNHCGSMTSNCEFVCGNCGEPSFKASLKITPDHITLNSKELTMDNMIHISGGPDKDTVVELRSTIMSILEANVDGKVKIAALDTLVSLAQTKTTSISHCKIDGSTHNHYPHSPVPPEDENDNPHTDYMQG